MQPFNRIASKTIALKRNNIDTDQIIPARFLKVTDKEGLGTNAFADWRYKEDGSHNEDFPLNAGAIEEAKILIAGDNFGCGSSREHAPWALLGFGLRAVVSTSIADIFRNNSLKNGFLPIVVDPAFHEHMMENEGAETEIDLEGQTITCTGRSYKFDIDPFARFCLLRGQDQLDYMLSQEEHINTYEETYV